MSTNYEAPYHVNYYGIQDRI